MAKQRWNNTKELLSHDFKATCSQSKESMDATGFIEVNRNYSGSHKIELIELNHEYDCWDHSSSVITRTYIKSKMPDGKSIELYAISFFKIEHNENGEKKISSLIEYWAETYPAPTWRSQWVKTY